jgi:hypothetical protein
MQTPPPLGASGCAQIGLRPGASTARLHPRNLGKAKWVEKGHDKVDITVVRTSELRVYVVRVPFASNSLYPFQAGAVAHRLILSPAHQPLHSDQRTYEHGIKSKSGSFYTIESFEAILWQRAFASDPHQQCLQKPGRQESISRGALLTSIFSDLHLQVRPTMHELI